MLDTAAIGELGGEEVLTFIAEKSRVRLEADVAIFLAGAHFADVDNGDALDANGRVLPGMEQAKRLGGPGTPRVREFAAARLAVQLGISPIAAKYLMADTLDVRHRLPQLWARLRKGEVAVWLARKVAKATRHLSLEAAAFVDAAVSLEADGRLSFSRFESLLEAKVIEADVAAAAAAEEKAAQARFARVGRSNEHGVRSMYTRALGRDIAWLDAAIARVAEALKMFGDGDNEDVRRSRAAGVLANPLQALQLLQDYAEACKRGEAPDAGTPDDGSTDGEDSAGEPQIAEADLHPAENDADDPAPQPSPCPTCEGSGSVTGDATAFVKPTRLDPSVLLPKVVLYVHVAGDTVIRDHTGVVRWEGEGPVTAQHVKEFLGPYCRFTIKPVIDLENMTPADAYEVPGRLREAVHLISPADIFPFASSTDQNMDADHNEAYDANGPPGQTRVGNLGPMVRFHHRIKTFGSWRVRQPFPGIFIWRSPVGEYFLVDHTGTRRLGAEAGGETQTSDGEVTFAPMSDAMEYAAR